MLLPDLVTWNELQPPFGTTDGIGDADSLGNNPLIIMKFPKKILLIDHEPGVTDPPHAIGLTPRDEVTEQVAAHRERHAEDRAEMGDAEDLRQHPPLALDHVADRELGEREPRLCGAVRR